MKKLFALVLSAVMLCTLTMSALAYDPAEDLDPPLWKIWGFDAYEEVLDGGWTEEEYAQTVAYVKAFMADRPEETAKFEAGAYDYFAEEFDGTPEEYMELWGQTEEEFIAEMVVWQILDVQEEEEQAARWAEKCREEPERTARFLAELDGWLASQRPWLGSVEKYCALRGLSQEGAYLELFEEWNWAYEWAQAQLQARNEFLTAHGGVPGQVNVMIDGKCVAFPDAVPEVRGGRTMVPFRAVMESLGGEVAYNGSDDISCIAGGYKYTFAVGSDTVTVRPTADNDKDVPQPEDIVMDCAPYIKDGRTYIPVRFLAEALGYDVDWDSEYRTAVITDTAALIESIDEDFTVLNGLLGRTKAGAPEGDRRVTAGYTVDVTLFDSLDGDETKELSLDLDAVASPSGVSGTLDYDLGALWELYESYVPMPLVEGGTQDGYLQQIEAVKGLLSGSMEVREDLEEGMVYYHMPAINFLLRQAGVEVSEDSWLSVSIEELQDALAGAELPELTPTVGGLLVRSYNSSGYTVKSWDDIAAAAALVEKLMGDGKFTREEDAQVFTLTRDDLAALLLSEDYDADPDSLPDEFELTVTLRDSGAVEFDFNMRMAAPDSYGLVDVRVTAHGSGDDEKMSMTMEIHMKNIFKVVVELTQQVSATDEEPKLAPPEGAEVCPIEELRSGGAQVPGMDGLIYAMAMGAA